jgi:glutathione synthase/RimK-type ligase-like ATP-grasp enzyme
MEIANNERALVRAVKEIAAELNLKLNTFSQDWVMRLERGAQTRHIFGYNFDLNGASGQLITNDKSASAELLSYNNIPAVEHRLFLRPNLAGYVASEGNWREMLSYFERNKADVVCKSNTGTGGNQVFRAQTPLELELAVHQLFSSNRAIALSPFIKIDSEYRLIMLGNSCELAYEKVRPRVTGDGRSTLLELISRDDSVGELGMEKLIANLSKEDGGLLSSVAGQDECVVLSWKHNLGQGAKAVEVNEERLKASLSEIAVSCMKALNLNFVSVDIIRSHNDGLSVMEINSGVMMESYSRQGEKEYERAKGIYRSAILRMLS